MGNDSLMDFLLNPAVWWIALGIWVFVWLRQRNAPSVAAKFNRKTARPGDLFADGSTATSKTEQKVRDTIEKAGYRLYPPSTRVYTPKDGDGKNRKYTPDIMLKKPKMIVEVDPHFWHGDNDRIAHDIDRNRMYARLGYTIVRVRIAGTLALSPNDVVLGQGDFDPDRDGATLLKGIRRAKFYPPRFWGDARRYIEQGNAPGAGLTAQQQNRRQRMYPQPYGDVDYRR